MTSWEIIDPEDPEERVRRLEAELALARAEAAVPDLHRSGYIAGTKRPAHEDYAMAWLASYRSHKTISGYRTGISQWFRFCEAHSIDPLAPARAHVDAFMHQLEALGRSPRTRALRLTTIASYYEYLLDEDVIGRNPTRKVMRPKVPRQSNRAWLSRQQMYDLVEGAEELGPHPHALVSVLAFNGLRVAEACSLDVESLERVSLYPILRFIRKGGFEGTVALSPPCEAAVVRAIGERLTGPMFLNSFGGRHNQKSAQRVLDKAMLNVRGRHGRITPHSLRHSWCSIALASGASPDQVQYDAGWTSPRMMGVYAHGQDNPARSSTHVTTSSILGVA